MPLLGKIVVIKRNGADGTEFPLTASCLFGRKLDCDIRIQLPQVSKEHCRIELNENKELILTNLSSVNPTRINGEIMQQSERLKHGDLITIIDRSFRFEYPPPPTPKKKRLSTSEKGETVKVLQDQQTKSTPGSTDKRKSEHSLDTCLKDGSNLQVPLDQSLEVTKGDGSQQATDSTMSPFSELYHMVKRDLVTKSPWKAGAPPKSPLTRPQADKEDPRKVLGSPAELPNKPATPKSATKKRRSSNVKAVVITESDVESSFAADSVESSSVEVQAATPAVQDSPAKQKRRSAGPTTPKASEASASPVSQKKTSPSTPQKFSAEQVAQQILFDHSNVENTPKSPKSRRSGGSRPQSPAVTPKSPVTPQTPSSQTTDPESEVKQSPRVSPRANAGKRFTVEDVLSVTATTPASDKSTVKLSSKKHKCDDLPNPVSKRKRVSFGGQLSPELFDKRLPPNSPLRRGATPGRRSLSFCQKPQSLLRRASTIGLMGFQLEETVPESPGKTTSPRRASSPGKSPKSASPKKTTSLGKSPKATPVKSASPKKTTSPGKSPKATPAKSASSPGKSPKATPAKSASSPGKSPKATPAKSASSPGKSPKATPAKSASSPGKSPKATPGKSPKATPAKSASSPGKSPKATPAKSESPRRASSPGKSPKATPAKSPSLKKTTSPGKSPKATPTKSASPARASSPGKSPKATPAKTSTPAKAKTPSPKNTKTPIKTPTPSSSRATPKTPLTQTPTVQGRFSITQIATPSPDREEQVKADSVPALEMPQECVTPKIPLRRISMKSSARKTPKSALKSAFEVMRSRRSGASRANLKVVSSWADIVKFGQIKTQPEQCTKKTTTKQKTVKQTKVPKPKTPARRLKDITSTGHADSPATIVVGKACMRKVRAVGAAPKIVPNIALFKKDMKMDEDLTGVADIFKTPANNKRKSVIADRELPETPLGASAGSLTEMSVMNTPEEIGEMLVSPMTVAKVGHYNSEAVTRLLQDDQNASLIEKDLPVMDESNDLPVTEMISVPENLADDHLEEDDDAEPNSTPVQTPQRGPAPVECLTGIKRIMKTPKQKSEPIEDLRGKLLKTPREPKPTQEEDFEGVKELLNTPKQKATPVKDVAGLKKLKTPKLDSPVVCAVALKKLMKTPKEKTEQNEDLTGVKQLMQTPKFKGEPVEERFGLKRLMNTPKQKSKPVEEDLTGVQQLMKTPKLRSRPVEEDLTGVQQLMKTPKLRIKPVEEDLTGIQEMMKTPQQKSKPAKEELTDISKTPQQMKTPNLRNKPVEEDLSGIQQMMKTPKLRIKPVEEDLTGIQEMMKTPQQAKTPKQKSQPAEEDLSDIQQIKTPKLRNKPVEEDLTGIQQMMKTPKLRSKPVEDLTGIQQVMKTPKQKCEPVEALTGMKRLLRTPKQRVEPVENEFGISQLMKTPKQRGGGTEDVAVLNVCDAEPMNKSTPDVAEVAQNDTQDSVEVQEPSVTSELAVEDAAEESEDKENIRPAEIMNNETKTFEEEDVSSVKVTSNEKEIEEPVQESVSEALSPVKAAEASLATPKKGEAKLPLPAKKTPLQESQKIESVCAVAAEIEEETITVENVPKLSASVKGRRGKVVIESLELVSFPSPVRKSARAKAPKNQVEDKEANQMQALTTSEDVEEVSKCPSEPVKPRRGRKAEQSGAEVEPVVQVNAVVGSEATEPSAEVEASLKSPAPVTKAKRGRKAKNELDNLQTIPTPEELNTCESAVEEENVEPESVELLSTEEVVSPVKTTRGRRGKTTKKEAPRSTEIEESEPAPDNVESCVTSSDVLVADEQPQVSVIKPGRGRRAKLGDLPVVSETVPVEPDQEPAQPAVKCGRQTKSKQQKTQLSEDADDQPPAVESSETEEHLDTVVKSVRGGRKTKQQRAAQDPEEPPKTVEEESEVNSDAVKQSEIPALKSTRGKRTVITKVKPEGPVKRGRRAVVEEVPPPVVRPSRGRKAAVNVEHEVAEDLISVEESSKESETETLVSLETSESSVKDVHEVPAKRGRGRIAKTKASVNEVKDATLVEDPAIEAKVPESETETPSSQESSECEVIEAAPAKRGRGRIAKTKASTKAPPVEEAKIPETETVPQESSESSVLDGAEEAVHEPPAKRGRGRNTKTKASSKESLVSKAEEAKPVKEEKTPESETDETSASQESSECEVVDVAPARRGRGRNAKTKASVNKSKDAPLLEDPAKEAKIPESETETPATQESSECEVVEATPAKRGRITKTKASTKKNLVNDVEEVTDETLASQESSECSVEDVVCEAPAKRGRGRNAKAKASTNESLVKEDESTAEESGVRGKRTASKKAVNWKSDLVTWKNIEAAEDESQQKAESPAEDTSISETKQSSEPAAKARRGRLGKKQEEPLAEKSETVVEENAPVVRRGRAGAKTEGPAVAPRRGNKRKETEVVVNEVSEESLPKRRRGKAASPEAQPDVAALSDEKMAEAEQSEPTSKKEESKPIKGKRKAAQEVESTQSEDSVSEPTTRRGTRGQKKTEPEVTSAPVRRTRRK